MVYSNNILNAAVSPTGAIEMLSSQEVALLTETLCRDCELFALFRQCALAVLNTGTDIDDPTELMAMFKDFDVEFQQLNRGIKLCLTHAPESAFVDGKMIKGVREHLFAVLRDILYANEIAQEASTEPTDVVFKMLRNADTLTEDNTLFAVCWGGHSINTIEYDYTKLVGYQLGLRGLGIVTGCGPGAMKGPMKGATIGHAKQRTTPSRYVGLTEPGIIAAESPNAIVNELVILPDIEKRLEAFVRFGHVLIVFPGGPGTAEEILYAIALLSHPQNEGYPLPLMFTAPKESAAYFEAMDRFLREVLGEEVTKYYTVVIDDAAEVGRWASAKTDLVYQQRTSHQDSYRFNWGLSIPSTLQEPFEPTHETMGNLNLSNDQSLHDKAVTLRALFSGVVAGNVKPDGVAAVKEHGPFLIKGDAELLKPVDAMLQSMVEQQRMKIGGGYKPCYRVIA